MSNAQATGLLLGLALGLPVLLALFGYAYARRRTCPACGQRLPVIRRPASLREAVQGGWTCSGCGTAVDRQGRSLPPTQTP